MDKIVSKGDLWGDIAQLTDNVNQLMEERNKIMELLEYYNLDTIDEEKPNES